MKLGNFMNPEKPGLNRYFKVPIDEKVGEKQGKKWECFLKWKHLFEKETITLVFPTFQEARKAFQEIRIAQSQMENKMRIWLDNNATIKGVK